MVYLVKIRFSVHFYPWRKDISPQHKFTRLLNKKKIVKPRYKPLSCITQYKLFIAAGYIKWPLLDLLTNKLFLI